MFGGGEYANKFMDLKNVWGVMPKYFRDLKKKCWGGGLCPNILDFKNVSGGGGYANKFYGLKKIVEGGRVMPKYFIDLKIVGVGVCQQILWT